MKKCTRMNVRYIATILVVLVLISQAVWSQSGRRLPGTAAPKDDDVIKLRAVEVLLNIAVSDDYGHQVVDLRKDDFIIAEDGQRQDISTFQTSVVPVNVILLLDASGSVINELSSIRDAAVHFVEHLGPEDKVSIFEFHTKVEVIQDWTSNLDDLKHAIMWRFRPGPIPKAGGNTSLYDAIYLASDEKLATVTGRKAIIILTDGDDTSSKVTYEQALAALIRSDAVVYVVSKAQAMIEQLKPYRGKVSRILGGGTAQQADWMISRLEQAENLMKNISMRTGGELYSPLKDEELKGVYGQVAHELKSQYILTYISKNDTRDGKLRHIRVYMSKPGLTPRTRDSYYAPRN